jgi:hypothetical protein
MFIVKPYFMKIIFIACFMVFAALWASAQSRQHPVAEPWSSGQVMSARIVLPHAPGTVKEALRAYLQSSDMPSREKTRYASFQNTALMESNARLLNMTFRVGPTEPNSETSTTVYLLRNPGAEKGPYGTSTPQFSQKEAEDFLNNLALVVDDYAKNSIEEQITLTTTAVKRGEVMVKKCTQRCDRLNSRKEIVQQRAAQNRRSAIRRNQSLARRLTESQNALAYERGLLEQQRSSLSQLSSQKLDMNY